MPLAMKSFRVQVLGILVALAIIPLGVVIEFAGFPPDWKRTQNILTGSLGRAELIRLHREISIYTPEAEVQSRIDALKSPYLTLNSNHDRKVVETPRQIFAKDWQLFLEIRDGQVIALRIRYRDSGHHHPKLAPSDKTVSDVPSLPEFQVTDEY